MLSRLQVIAKICSVVEKLGFVAWKIVTNCKNFSKVRQF